MNKNKNKTPLIVAVETSGRHGSVALAAGEQLLGQTTFSEPMTHSSQMFPAIEQLLERFGKRTQKIDHVYVSVGPGSFTGLRIGVTFAKILHLACSAKVVAVDSLDVIASNVTELDTGIPHGPRRYQRLAAILDAKRGRFFVSVYQKTDKDLRQSPTGMAGYEKLLPDCLMTPEGFIEKFSGSQMTTGLLGEGLVYYKERFSAAGIEIMDEKYWWPGASNVHRLGRIKALRGEFENPLQLQPFYLRQPQLGQSKLLLQTD